MNRCMHYGPRRSRRHWLPHVVGAATVGVLLFGYVALCGAERWAAWEPQPVTLPTLHVVIDSHHLDYHGTERQIRPGVRRSIGETE